MYKTIADNGTNQRLNATLGSNLLLANEYAIANSSLQGVSGHTNLPIGQRQAGPRRGKESDRTNADMSNKISHGAANMAVGAVEQQGIKAGLVAAGVQLGPAGWVALGVSLFLPKVF